MKMKLFFLSFILMFGAFVVDAQVQDLKPRTNTIRPAGRTFFFAELVSTETSNGRTVSLQIEKDYKNYFPETDDQKMIAALMSQEFRSIPQALNFLSMNGWEFVDQFTIQRDRDVEQRVLVKRPAGLMKQPAKVK